MPRRVEWERPCLYPKQSAVFFNDSRFSACQASTKSGKSIGAAAWLVEETLRRCQADGAACNGLWVAPTHRQAIQIGWKRICNALPPAALSGPPTRSPFPMIPLVRGCELHFLGGDRTGPSGTIYGSGYRALVMDEASRCKKALWEEVRSPLVATKGRARLIGNLVTGSWFDTHCDAIAKGLKSGWEYHELTWEDAVEAGVLDRDEIEQAKQDYDEATFLELFSVVRREHGSNPFGLQHIANARTAETAPDERQTDISWSSNTYGPPVAWGWDMAASLSGSANFTFGVGLDKHSNVCRMERFRLESPDTRARMKRVCKGRKLRIRMDGQGIGKVIHQEMEPKERKRFVLGDDFKNRERKRALLDSLGSAIQKGETRHPRGVLDFELSRFQFNERTGRYEHGAGAHDDGVDAYALARKALKRKRRVVTGAAVI